MMTLRSACFGTLSVYQSNTGQLLWKTQAHSSSIRTLNFSPNFKYIVSTAKDKYVRIYTWPNLTEYFNIEFSSCIKVNLASFVKMLDRLCLVVLREKK